MNYPLSPETIFPQAVVSVLKCLQWLRKEHGVTTVALTGDSAGGNLATVAAAIATNPPLLRFLEGAADEFSAETFPKLNGVVSMYGLLDRTSFFEHDTPTISRLEMALSRFALDFIYYAYTGDENFHESVPALDKPFEGRCTISDFLDVVDQYPRTFLVVGTRDVLVHSSRKAHALLLAKGFSSEIHEYDARHAFIGLPPALNIGGTWRYHSKPATEKIVSFLESLEWDV
jgi:acetyl esterase/lipase